MTNYIEYNADEALLQTNCTLVEVENFISSALHKDFQKEIKIRIAMLTAMLDDPKMQYTGRDYDVFRGGKRAMLELHNIFEDIQEGLINIKEEDEDV